MKKNERLLYGIGDADDEYIYKSVPGKTKKKRKKHSFAKRFALAAVIVVFVLALLTAAAAAAMIYHYIGLIKTVEDGGQGDVILPGQEDFETYDQDEAGADGANASAAPERSPDDINWAPDVEEPIGGSGLLNILIIGQDRREGEPRQRSDSMMLVSINAETKKVSLISFLRDMYVQIPGGYSDNRLNVAYKYGGFQLIKETFYKNFGIEVDGCFECDFFDFIDIIDILGGVEITLTEKEAEHMTNFLSTPAEAGTHLLSGEQALAYARIRKIDSDFQRTRRQRTILMTLFNGIKSANIIELHRIAESILPKLLTDMDDGMKLDLLTKLLPMVGSMEISTYSVPFEGAYEAATIRKMQVLVPDLSAIRDKLGNEYLPK